MEIEDEINFLFNKTVDELNQIMLTEWEEVKRPVTWKEAIEARMNGKGVYFIYEKDKFELYGDVLGIYSINGELVEYDDEEECIDFDMLQNGEWFIED